MTREELQVGKEYKNIFNSKIKKIVFVGTVFVVYKYRDEEIADRIDGFIHRYKPLADEIDIDNQYFDPQEVKYAPYVVWYGNNIPYHTTHLYKDDEEFSKSHTGAKKYKRLTQFEVSLDELKGVSE